MRESAVAARRQASGDEGKIPVYASVSVSLGEKTSRRGSFANGKSGSAGPASINIGIFRSAA